MAISSHRLVSDENGQVTFRYKDYRRNSEWKTTRVRGEEFVRRLALHILPTRFMRVRHCGLFGNSHAAKNLAIARMFLGATLPDPDQPPADKAHSLDEMELQAPRCHDCDGVAMEWVAKLLPLVSWAICRYGHFANRTKGAGFGASTSRIDAATKTHATPTQPDARPP